MFELDESTETIITDKTDNIENTEIIIIEEKTPSQERADYFLQLVSFFEKLAPFSKTTPSIPSFSSIPYYSDIKIKIKPWTLKDIFHDHPNELEKCIRKISYKTISSDEELFLAIKPLYKLLSDHKKGLNDLTVQIEETLAPTKKMAESSSNDAVFYQERLVAMLKLLLPLKFAATQRASIIFDFLNEIFPLYIEVEKIVSPKKPLENEKLFQKVKALLANAAITAQERLSNAEKEGYSETLKGVKANIHSLDKIISNLNVESETPESLQALLTQLIEKNVTITKELETRYPAIWKDTGGDKSFGYHIESWEWVPSADFRKGSYILTVMDKAYRAAKNLIHEQKIIEENNNLKPSHAFFPRTSIKLKLTKPIDTKSKLELDAEFTKLKTKINDKWSTLKGLMDNQPSDIKKNLLFKNLESALKNLYTIFKATSKVADLKELFEPVHNALKELQPNNSESENSPLDKIERAFFGFINFTITTILQEPAYATDIYQKSLNQFCTITPEVHKNLQEIEEIEKAQEAFVLSINDKIEKLYCNFIADLKREIIQLAYHPTTCPQSDKKAITPTQALDYLNLLCSIYTKDKLTPNSLLLFVSSIVTELTIYYPETVQSTLFPLALSVFNSVDNTVKLCLDEARSLKSGQVLSTLNMVSSNSPPSSNAPSQPTGKHEWDFVPKTLLM